VTRVRLLERIAEAVDVLLTTRAEDERQLAEEALEDALVALHDHDADNLGGGTDENRRRVLPDPRKPR
jgi:hypothetical protein